MRVHCTRTWAGGIRTDAPHPKNFAALVRGHVPNLAPLMQRRPSARLGSHHGSPFLFAYSHDLVQHRPGSVALVHDLAHAAATVGGQAPNGWYNDGTRQCHAKSCPNGQYVP